ncbi:DNA sulfur modification protein DndB [Rummeliibacillus stabekisii]|uniref:DNA sulfur modification protein DndB n=1 Tax=Rummeliibacillus stabekisii TaxID=241244 RepID=UPI003724A0C2
MNKKAFKFTQSDQIFYSTIFKFDEIYDNSYVSVYSRENRLGYQRSLNERHLKKIVLSLKKNDTPISPTSILLGIDSENISSMNETDIFLNLTFYKDELGGKLFRIIDGQHRINSIAKYIKELDSSGDYENIERLRNYEFSVIIMPIDTKRRIREVETFQSINSKAKPLKTDLTKLALIRYQEMEKEKFENYSNHIAHRIIFSLNDNTMYEEINSVEYGGNAINVWKNAIIIDLNNDDEVGIIGYSAFSKSIEPICKFYSDQLIKMYSNYWEYYELDSILNIISNELTFELFIPAWNIIMEKWPECFGYTSINIQTEMFYNEDYYLQKNMGLRPLHQIIFEIIKEVNEKNDFPKILELFKEKIMNSSVRSEDWRKAGTFKGLSSESGFKLIKEVILGENEELLY